MSEPLTDAELAEITATDVFCHYCEEYFNDDQVRLLATIAAREQTIKGMQQAFVRDTATIEELLARIVLLEAALRVAIELLTACRSDYSYGGSGDVQEFLDGSYPALLSPLSERPEP